MASNKFNKKAAIQLTLITIGVLLVFLIYFSGPIKKDEHQKTSEDISGIKGDKEEDKNKNIFEDLEYKGKDNNGNKFVIFSEYSDFQTDRPELINMKNIVCYFNFKDGTVLEIRSKTGTYNNVTLDMSFTENVNMFYEDSSLFSDKADFSNANSLLVVEGNVRTQNPDGDLMADKLNFDFTDKKLKVSMYNEDRVNIKTKF
tara:strand:+ start:470 stop:1072 length:603 start_codon:yes stop_codon:yes gene_type:complete